MEPDICKPDHNDQVTLLRTSLISTVNRQSGRYSADKVLSLACVSGNITVPIRCTDEKMTRQHLDGIPEE